MKNNDFTIQRFDCDEDLSKYTDSMLFDDDEIIALLDAVDNKGYFVQIQVATQGEIAVRMLDSDEPYIRSPNEYTSEIRRAIEESNYDVLDVDASNSFVIRYNILNDNGEEVDRDGDCFESDISEMSVEELKNSMLEYAENVLDYYCQRESLEISKREKEEL